VGSRRLLGLWNDNMSETILNRWSITAEDLTVAIDENPSLRGMLLGYVAEYKLRSLWFMGRSEITHSIKHDDHNRKKKGDLVVTYKGHSFIIESKSLQTHSIRKDGDLWVGKAQCDASDRRTVTFTDGSTLETTCLLAGEFDILAVNLFAFENQWLHRDGSLRRIAWSASPLFDDQGHELNSTMGDQEPGPTAQIVTSVLPGVRTLRFEVDFPVLVAGILRRQGSYRENL